MTRLEYNTKSFDEIMDRLNEENDEVTTKEDLINFVKYNIDNDNLFLAIHILEAINNDKESEWFLYDYCMGTLQMPSSVIEKEHIEHLIED